MLAAGIDARLLLEPRRRPRPELFEDPYKLDSLNWLQDYHRFFHIDHVLTKGFFDQAPPRRGQLDNASPKILGIRRPLNEVFGFESVDGGGDGPAGKQNFFADNVNRLRSLVEEDLQNCKVGQAEA